MSVRIEELNAQISTLYVENLRLRASEIALATQLKKEREKSRKIIVDTEAAVRIRLFEVHLRDLEACFQTHSLLRHLGHMRKSFNVPLQAITTPEAPAPRARRPTANPNTSPTVPRLARPPTIPGIIEDDESNLPQEPHGYLDEEASSPTPHRRKSKPRSSAARPPVVEDVPAVQFDEDMNKSGKRKPTRRPSGLLTTKVAIATVLPTESLSPPRPPSPAFGSPLRRAAALEEEEEVLAAISVPEPMDEDEDDEPIAMSVTRRDKRKKSRDSDRPLDWERGTELTRDREPVAVESRRDREKRRVRDSDEGPGPLEAKKPKLKDVTNSPPPRPSLATLEIPPGTTKALTNISQ